MISCSTWPGPDQLATHWLLLVISPSPGAFRNRGSPQLARAVTAEISQNINSPLTGWRVA
jgi:hypothetical protein